MKFLLSFAALVTTVLAGSRTSAPSGCITVSSGGSIQKAVDSLSTSASGTQCIFIAAGTYKEQVLVPARKAQLTFYGYTSDTNSYSANKVTITNNKAAASGASDDETGTLRVKAANFKAYNINIKNSYGKGSQAIALSAYADSGYYACQITGYQDTVLAQQGYQLYAKSYIEGATDFVFGQYAQAWFNDVDIGVLAASQGTVTANGRVGSDGSSYYVFNSCSISAASGQSVSSGAYYLGRPWTQYARVVFQYTSMSSVINSAGWEAWSSSDTRTSGVLFGEYSNSGAGSSGSRASFAKKLGSAVSINTILGSNYKSAGYYDGSYM